MVPDFGAFSPTAGDRCRGRYASSRSGEGPRARDLPARRPGVLAVLRPRRANASTAEGLERSLRDAAARVDATVPISAVQSLAALADTTWAWRRSSMALLAALAVSACVLAFVGVYGVMAFGGNRAVSRDRRPRGARRQASRRCPNDPRAGAPWLTGCRIGDRARARRARGRRPERSSLRRHAGSIRRPSWSSSIVTAAAGLLATAMPALTAMRIDPTEALKGE